MAETVRPPARRRAAAVIALAAYVGTFVAILVLLLAAWVLLRSRTIAELVLVAVVLVLATLTARYGLGADPRALRDRPPPGEHVSGAQHPWRSTSGWTARMATSAGSTSAVATAACS